MRRSGLVIGLLFGLSSCWSAYRQESSTHVLTDEVVHSSVCTVRVQGVSKNPSGYYIYVSLAAEADLQLDLSALTLALSDKHSAYRYQSLGLVPTSAADLPKGLLLKKGDHYDLKYDFKGEHRRELRLEIASTIGGAAENKTLFYKKHHEVQIFH